jgi:hypothetical protein
MWKEAVVAQFEVLPRHLLGGTEKNKTVRIAGGLTEIWTWILSYPKRNWMKTIAKSLQHLECEPHLRDKAVNQSIRLIDKWGSPSRPSASLSVSERSFPSWFICFGEWWLLIQKITRSKIPRDETVAVPQRPAALGCRRGVNIVSFIAEVQDSSCKRMSKASELFLQWLIIVRNRGFHKPFICHSRSSSLKCNLVHFYQVFWVMLVFRYETGSLKASSYFSTYSKSSSVRAADNLWRCFDDGGVSCVRQLNVCFCLARIVLCDCPVGVLLPTRRPNKEPRILADVYFIAWVDFNLLTWILADHSGRAVFARSDAGIMGSNPIPGMDVCVRLFCV